MTGSLQIKKGIYFAVLSFKDEQGMRRQKWISTKFKVKTIKEKLKKN